MPEETIGKLLRELVANGATAEEATDEVLSPYTEDPLREFARPAIYQTAMMELRNHTRRIERKLFEPGPGREAEYFAAVREKLASLTFKVNGEAVTWEKATVVQHQARVLYLRQHVDGIQRTIARHMRAVEVLTEFGATCLSEIPDWRVLAPEPEMSEVAPEERAETTV